MFDYQEERNIYFSQLWSRPLVSFSSILQTWLCQCALSLLGVRKWSINVHTAFWQAWQKHVWWFWLKFKLEDKIFCLCFNSELIFCMWNYFVLLPIFPLKNRFLISMLHIFCLNKLLKWYFKEGITSWLHLQPLGHSNQETKQGTSKPFWSSVGWIINW